MSVKKVSSLERQFQVEGALEVPQRSAPVNDIKLTIVMSAFEMRFM